MSAWIDWKGGDCPLPKGTSVEIRCRNEAAWDAFCDVPAKPSAAEFLRWSHKGMGGDIIAYRIAERLS